MIAVILALCGAASNGLATVLQRKAAKREPDTKRFRPGLMLDLFRRPVWLGGAAAGIGGFVFQAASLNFGQLSLVQPLLAMELPMTLIIRMFIFHSRLGIRAWLGSIGMALGLAILLFSLQPAAGSAKVPTLKWVVVLAIGLGVILALVVAGRSPGPAGAAFLGAAAGTGFGITAAIMKQVTVIFHVSMVGILVSWQLYAMIAIGILAFYLLQNALQSGSLVAAQPAVTLSDPVVSVALGVVLFHDQVRLGLWLIPELFGFGLILAGSIELSRSPALTDRAEA